MSLCTTTKKTNKSKIFFFQQKTTFFSFLFVIHFFHKAASLSALLELNVKKYARESLFLDIFSERERTLLKEQRIRRVFLYHCLSFCE